MLPIGESSSPASAPVSTAQPLAAESFTGEGQEAVDLGQPLQSEPASSTPTATTSRLNDPEPSASTSPGTLHMIRPLPKAGLRSEKRTIRKRGRTRILTDTLEKQLIEQDTGSRSLTKTSKQSTGLRNNDSQAKKDGAKQAR
ncbi:hypothetical protein ACJMK2_040239 [Sinanodonta woodiana]|uniref:Uncharacterized protein n=1 Tax=Sinanodonta woodiana TaxID=1069815 RepID=A0ABD3WG04_SINWO